MAFEPEPICYEKGIMSELQAAWEYLRNAVFKIEPSKVQNRLNFHIEEAMSWESIRDLKSMHKALVLVTNIAKQGQEDEEIIECIEEIWGILNDVFISIKNGEEI